MADNVAQVDNLELNQFEGFFPTMFEYYLNLQDRGDDQFTIVSKLKTFLLDNQIGERHLNHIINSFYDYYSIRKEEGLIENVPIYQGGRGRNAIDRLFNSFNPVQEPIAAVDRHRDGGIENLHNDLDNVRVLIDGIRDQFRVMGANQQEPLFNVEYRGIVDLNNFVRPPVDNQEEHNSEDEEDENDEADVQPAQEPLAPGPGLLPIRQPPQELFNALFGAFLNGRGLRAPMTNVAVTTKEEDIKAIKTIKLENDLEEKCPVCFDKFCKDDEVLELKCKHLYHKECCEDLLSSYSNKCSVCRAEVGKAEYKF
jgi:hypothetical protein